MTGRVLIQFAHPSPSKSRVNKALRNAISDLDGIVINDLYERYPEMHVNAEREQALLTSCELLVFMHPMYWYSAPPILKEWQDTVLEFGFAYGREGTALKGKQFMSVVSAGGDEESYASAHTNGADAESLLMPYTQTARFCGMTPLAPHLIYGTHTISDERIADEAMRLRQRMNEWLERGA